MQEFEAPSKRKVEKALTTLRRGVWSRREEAALELAAMGPGALEALESAWEEADDEREIDGLLSHIEVAQLRIALEHPESVEIFGRMLASKSGSAKVAARALSLMDERALPVLQLGLKHRKGRNRALAAGALGFRRSRGAPAADKLRRLLESNSSEDVRWQSALALGRIRARDAAVLAALEAAVSDEVPDVAAHAVWSLSQLDTDGIPGLLRALGEPHVASMASAHLALRGPHIVPAVLDWLPSAPTDAALVQALLVLGWTAGDHADGKARVAELLEHPAPDVRAEAVVAYTQLVEAAAPLVPVLSAALADDDELVRIAACRAIGTRGEEFAPLESDLLSACTSAVERGEEALGYVHALLSLPSTEATTTTTLLDLYERSGDANLLVALVADSERAVPHILARAGEDLSIELRTSYCVLLGAIGEPGVPTLVDWSRNAVDTVRGQALRALELTDTESPEALEALEEAWKTQSLRRYVAMALSGDCGAGNALLRRAFKTERKLLTAVREHVIHAVGIHDPDGRGVLSRLTDLATEDRSDAIRQAAVRAIARGQEDLDKRVRALEQVLLQVGSPPRADGSGEEPPHTHSVQAEALRGLIRLADKGEHAVSTAARYLDHRHPGLRTLAAAVLRITGEAAGDAAVALSRRIHDDEPLVRTSVLLACGNLGKEVRPIQTTLGLYITHMPSGPARVAVEALLPLGAEAKLITPYLLVLLLRQSFEGAGWEQEDLSGMLMGGRWQPKRSTDLLSARRTALEMLVEIGSQDAGEAALIRPCIERLLSERDEGLHADLEAALERL